MSYQAGRAAAAAEIIAVDDHPAVRTALRYTLEREAALVLRAEAETPAEGVRLARELSPDVAVVDLVFPSGIAFDLLRDLRAAAPRMRVVVWSAAQGSWYVQQALRLGARAFVSKSEPLEHLVAAIRVALAGGTQVDDPPARGTQTHLSGTTAKAAEGAAPAPRGLLSDRESAVLDMIGRGRTTPQIAAETGRSAKTIETFRYRIKRKLGLANSLELAQFAFREAQAGMGGAAVESASLTTTTPPLAADEHGAPGGAEARVGGEPVLLVSGLRMFRESLAHLLRDRGYDVTAVATTAGALASLARAVPGVVLLDPAPPRVGRRGLLEQLRVRAAWASVPVILFSSAGGGPLEERLCGMANEVILRNRFNVPDLLAKLDRTLALCRPARRADPAAASDVGASTA